MDGREESADRRVRIEVRHQTSAPPPNEKNDRTKELAANAIDRPNTIRMSLRAPPLLSPKASVRPVMMMIIHAMILSPGPSWHSRIAWSGAPPGMTEPAASVSGSRKCVVEVGDVAVRGVQG